MNNTGNTLTHFQQVVGSTARYNLFEKPSIPSRTNINNRKPMTTTANGRNVPSMLNQSMEAIEPAQGMISPFSKIMLKKTSYTPEKPTVKRTAFAFSKR